MISKTSFELYKNILCPPGNGVYTVNTAKDKKGKLHQILYSSQDNVVQKWMECLQQFSDPTEVYLLGIPSDAGGGILRGANWGPLAVRIALLDYDPHIDICDLGDVRVIPHFHHDKYLNEETRKNCQKALYGEETSLPVTSLSLTEYFCDDFFKTYPKAKLFSLGGDHSVSYPLVKSFLKAKKHQGKKIGLIHFDAHTDLLIQRLGVDICFGSWAAHILDSMSSPNLVYQFGIRSSGKDKSYWEEKFGVQQFWAKDIRSKGMKHFVDYAVSDMKKKRVDELYISFDIDAMDSTLVRKTGTPEEDGLFLEEVVMALNVLAENFPMTSCDLMEVAPFIDSGKGEDKTLEISGKLAHLMISLMRRY